MTTKAAAANGLHAGEANLPEALNECFREMAAIRKRMKAADARIKRADAAIQRSLDETRAILRDVQSSH